VAAADTRRHVDIYGEMATQPVDPMLLEVTAGWVVSRHRPRTSAGRRHARELVCRALDKGEPDCSEEDVDRDSGPAKCFGRARANLLEREHHGDGVDEAEDPQASA
jgi:hypothetical protein